MIHIDELTIMINIADNVMKERLNKLEKEFQDKTLDHNKIIELLKDRINENKTNIEKLTLINSLDQILNHQNIINNAELFIERHKKNYQEFVDKTKLAKEKAIHDNNETKQWIIKNNNKVMSNYFDYIINYINTTPTNPNIDKNTIILYEDYNNFINEQFKNHKTLHDIDRKSGVLRRIKEIQDIFNNYKSFEEKLVELSLFFIPIKLSEFLLLIFPKKDEKKNIITFKDLLINTKLFDYLNTTLIQGDKDVLKISYIDINSYLDRLIVHDKDFDYYKKDINFNNFNSTLLPLQNNDNNCYALLYNFMSDIDKNQKMVILYYYFYNKETKERKIIKVPQIYIKKDSYFYSQTLVLMEKPHTYYNFNTFTAKFSVSHHMVGVNNEFNKFTDATLSGMVHVYDERNINPEFYKKNGIIMEILSTNQINTLITSKTFITPSLEELEN